MIWIENKLINKSEISRQIGISATLFRMKLKRINRNKFTTDEIKRINDVKIKLFNVIK